MIKRKASQKNTASWVITCISTGYTWEVFDKKDAQAAEELCRVETIEDYLARINAEVKE